MAEQPPPRTHFILAGAICAPLGAYFTLAGLGLIPLLGGEKALRAPLFLILCAGIALLLCAVLVAMHLIGMTDANGNCAPGTPRWLRVLHYGLGLAVFCCFGVIASWIAFGPGTRQFSMSVMGAEGSANEMTGRIAFGIGAIVIWVATIAVAVSRWRKIAQDFRSGAARR